MHYWSLKLGTIDQFYRKKRLGVWKVYIQGESNPHLLDDNQDDLAIRPPALLREHIHINDNLSEAEVCTVDNKKICTRQIFLVI